MIDTGNDFTVDVLVIGAGPQGRYVANALTPTFSVCILTDPDSRPTALDDPGLISAGYTGNDAVRMQAARRTAGYWRHRADTERWPGASTPTYVALRRSEVATTTRLWDEAALRYRPDALPPVFEDGRLVGDVVTFRVDGDLVVDPGQLMRSVTPPKVPFVEGTVVRFGVDADSAVDHVEVETDHGLLAIAPRFVVLAAGLSNARLLAMVGHRLRDQHRRRELARAARRSQTVIDHQVVALRSAQLPLVAGTFDDITVVSHAVPDSPEVVWLVTGCPALQRLVPDDELVRFDPPVDAADVDEIVGRLRTASALVDRKVRDCRWSSYVAREAVHPSAAHADGDVGTPLPARLDSFGLESFLALWPSHLGYTMLLGDVVAERIAATLGSTAGRVDLRLVEAARAQPPPARSRWRSPSFLWHEWDTFAAIYGLPSPLSSGSPTA